MKRRRVAIRLGGIPLFLLAGALWIGMVRLVPTGTLRTVGIPALGFAFVVSYVWILITHVREILGGTPHLARHTLAVAAEVALQLAAFAAVHQTLGLMDNTRPGAPVVHDFWTSVYYSVATFTTLGYGDFYPIGPGRALAGMQALTGYLILGIVASTAASALSPHSKAGGRGERDDHPGGDR